jgi:N-acetylneuraminate synthase/N,N'-diacetyllegionaminate synthase
MANASDVARALSDLGEAAQRTVLLHCVSAYPAPVESCNLRAIGTLRALYNRPVGFSDHTTGSAAALAAVALGACALEKHLTLDRTLPGPDHAASLEPEELSELVGGVRAIEAALGSPPKRPQPVEQDVRAVARRGVVAARALSAGDLLDPTAIAARRPAAGLPPTELDELVGRRLLRALAPGEPIRWEAVSAQREDDRR